MKKKALVIGLLIGALCGVFAGIQGCVQGKLLIPPQATGEVRYNNYIFDNGIDCKDNRTAWVCSDLFGSTLHIVDVDGGHTYLRGVGRPFQLAGERVVFLNGDRLQVRTVEQEDTTAIATGVDRFAVYGDLVIYSAAEEETRALYTYDLRAKTQKSLCRDVLFFYVYKDALYAVDDDGWLSRLPFDGGAGEKLVQVPIVAYPFYIMPQGDDLVYRQANNICFLNVNTGEQRSVPLVDSPYWNNRITYICDDERVFVSFQATKTNGSVVTDVSDDHNGLWLVEGKTQTAQKVCGETFENLYLFDHDLLIGERDGGFYQIDPATGQVTKMTR